jgi:hypothetical protein
LLPVVQVSRCVREHAQADTLRASPERNVRAHTWSSGRDGASHAASDSDGGDGSGIHLLHPHWRRRRRPRGLKRTSAPKTARTALLETTGLPKEPALSRLRTRASGSLGLLVWAAPSSPAKKRSREPRRLVREQRVVTVVSPAPARPTSPRLLVLRVNLAQQAAHSSTKSTRSCGASDSDHAERRRVIDGRLLSFCAEPVWTDRVRRGMSGRCLVSTRLSRPAGCLRSQDSSVQPIGSPGSMGSDRARDTNYDADSGYSVAPPGTTRMSRGVPCRSDLPSPPRDRERRPSP